MNMANENIKITQGDPKEIAAFEKWFKNECEKTKSFLNLDYLYGAKWDLWRGWSARACLGQNRKT